MFHEKPHTTKGSRTTTIASLCSLGIAVAIFVLTESPVDVTSAQSGFVENFLKSLFGESSHVYDSQNGTLLGIHVRHWAHSVEFGALGISTAIATISGMTSKGTAASAVSKPGPAGEGGGGEPEPAGEADVAKPEPAGKIGRGDPEPADKMWTDSKLSQVGKVRGAAELEPAGEGGGEPEPAGKMGTDSKPSVADRVRVATELVPTDETMAVSELESMGKTTVSLLGAKDEAVAASELSRANETAVEASESALMGKAVGLALALCAGYSLFDQCHKLFVPGRHFDWFDLIMDAMGYCIAIAIVAIAARARK